MAAPVKSMGARKLNQKARKRSVPDDHNDESETGQKKKKSIFTEIDFKFHLNDPSTVILGKHCLTYDVMANFTCASCMYDVHLDPTRFNSSSFQDITLDTYATSTNFLKKTHSTLQF